MADHTDPPPLNLPSSRKLASPDKTPFECSPIRAASADTVADLSPIHENHPSSTKKSLIQMQNPDGFSSSPSEKTLIKPSSLYFEENEFLDVEPAQISSPNNTNLLQLDSNSDSNPVSPRLDYRPPRSYITNSEYQREDEMSWSFLKIQPTGVGAGLYNSGNTCFIAAVLQCFTHNVPLIESLSTYKFRNPCNCGSDKFCVIQTLRDHIVLALRSSGYNLYIDNFRVNLNHFSYDFMINRQEDAQEFLQSFLNKLERCCMDTRNRPGSSSSSSSSEDVNIVDNVFGGRLMSSLHCCNCDSVSNTSEPSLGWSLEIEDVENLWSALESFTSIEKLEDQFTCDDCKELVSKEKQLKLDKLPPVATFHLKRFENDGDTMGKISKHIEFPLELDLRPYMSKSSIQNLEVSTMYKLYAFVEHFGESATYGHYTSYVRSAPETWHHFNDSRVRRIDEDFVLSQEAYILFYVREEYPWFSTLFEQLKPDFEATSPTSVLDDTYDDVGVSNKASNDVVGVSIPGVISSHGPQQEVFWSAESGSDDDLVAIVVPKSPQADRSEKPFAETSQQRESESSPAKDRANIEDAYAYYVPELKVRNQNLSPKRKAGEEATIGKGPKPKIPKRNSVPKRQVSFRIQRAHLQIKEEKNRRTRLLASAADPKDTRFARSYLNRMQTPRARSLSKALDSSLMEKENLLT